MRPLLAALLLLAFPAAAAACTGADTPVTQGRLDAAQRAVRCLVNGEREARALPGFRRSTRLERAARRHGADMVRRHYFAHVSPGGRDVVARVRATGYVRGRWQVGEALATATGATPRALVALLMGSPEHRAIVLSRALRDVGAGLAFGAAPTGRAGATLVLIAGRRS